MFTTFLLLDAGWSAQGCGGVDTSLGRHFSYKILNNMINSTHGCYTFYYYSIFRKNGNERKTTARFVLFASFKVLSDLRRLFVERQETTNVL